MRPSLKMFCEIIMFLTVVMNSRAFILNCKFEETIDISHFERINDSYVYNGLEIPANLTGEYEFIELLGGVTKSVETHLRGCICQVKACIRFCCPRKNMLANGDCSDDLHEEIQQSNRSLSMVHFDKAWHKEEYNLRDMHIIRKHFEPCDEVINVRENEYTILKDGTFYLLALPKRLSNEEYCLYPQFDADFPKSVWLSHHWCKLNALTAAIEVHVISIICVIFTVVVYICVKELRDLLGKCLVCGLLSMLVNYLTALLETFGLATDICVLAGYSRYFLTMAHHLWFSVISYHLWNYFTSLNRSESPNRFRICNIIVWCTAAIPTGVIYLMNAVWGKDLQKWNWLPSIGFIQCSVKGTSRYSWLYQTGPLLFISSFNVIMFILISIHIWKVTNQLKKIVKQEERMKAVLEYDIPTYLRSVRVFIIMGVSWIMPLIMSLAQYFKFPYIIIISSYTESAFFIIVFAMLILRRRTYKLIMDRIRRRP